MPRGKAKLVSSFLRTVFLQRVLVSGWGLNIIEANAVTRKKTSVLVAFICVGNKDTMVSVHAPNASSEGRAMIAASVRNQRANEN